MLQQQKTYVILLGKALTLNGGHYPVRPGSHAPLVSLGYFDSIQIAPLPLTDPSGNWLRDVWRYSISLSGNEASENYYHPIYIMASPGQELPEDFWAHLESQFLFVTLVHFTATSYSTQPGPFQSVQEKITKLTEGSAQKVQATCFQTLGLSDMVVLWTSSSLCALLEQLHKFYLFPEVGDLRTACGLPLQSKLPTESMEEKIPYVSFRFVVKNAVEAIRFAKLVNTKIPEWPDDNGYFTTGAEDLDVVLTNFSVSEFLKLISLWFGDGDINQCFQDAFYDSSTRLGTRNEPAYPWPRTGISHITNPLTERCNCLLEEFKLRRNSLKDQHDMAEINLSWCKAVINQLNALSNMSRICELDGFCYLILDGAAAFCQMIDPKKHGSSPDSLHRIQRFVRGWGALMDQAIRADGQFVQSPGYSPVLYDIPVGLLEFYLAFANRCMDYLQAEEGEKYRYTLFLLPKLCRRTKVEDIFRAPPPCDRLLLVEVPVDLLYDPSLIMLQLCHEISHYSGTNFRQRDFRCKQFTLSCAHLIAWYLNLGSADAVRAIQKDLINEVVEEDLWLEKLFAKMQRCVVNLPRNYNVFRHWQLAHLDSFGDDEEKRMEAQRKSLELQREIFNDFSLGYNELRQDVERIRLLFAESYADMSMFFLLKPTWQEYIRLYLQELKWLGEPDDLSAGHDGNTSGQIFQRRASQYAELVQRAALVLLANPSCQPPKQPVEEPYLSDFSACIQEMYNALKNEETLPNKSKFSIVYQNCFPLDLLYDIEDYLIMCGQTMTRTVSGHEELAALQKIYSTIVRDHCIGCDGFRETVARYEQKLLTAEAIEE